jgi:hypothetical protein
MAAMFARKFDASQQDFGLFFHGCLHVILA